ncbi:MAG TPA: CHAT domain-containing protein [Actinomycetaceae bacterium]|nr:CHAT domain-containing protein [Actinomycetaceae bacterium]
MAKFWTSSNDPAAPRGDPARLVVTLTPVNDELYEVSADVDGGPPMTGQLVLNPAWRFQIERASSGEYAADPLQDVGAQLFRALFSGSLSRAWAQARERARAKGGLHIVIRCASLQLQSLPWELLSDRTLTSSSERIAISEGWSVIRDVHVSGDVHRDGRPVPSQHGDLEVLVLTTPSPGLDQEAGIDILVQAFGQEVVTLAPNADERTMLTALASGSAKIVHFLGSGRQWRSSVQDLVLSHTDPGQMLTVSGQQLTAATAEARQPELVVLAAGFTDQLAGQLATVVPAVIGFRGQVSDTGTEVFLAEFYRALVAGATVSQAVAAGRMELVLSQPLGDEWAQPVLYLSKDAPLIAALPVAAPAPEAVTLTGWPSQDEMTDLIVQMKQANLRALRAQWATVESANMPSTIASQMEALGNDLEELTGGAL